MKRTLTTVVINKWISKAQKHINKYFNKLNNNKKFKIANKIKEKYSMM